MRDRISIGTPAAGSEIAPGGRLRLGWSLLALLGLLAACGPAATTGSPCRTTATDTLPLVLRQSSGVAVSLEHPGILWTHDDDRAHVLYAIDYSGRIVARFPLDRTLADWEDLGLSTCPDGGSCLYLEDLGDDYEEHRGGQILRVPEPDPAHPDTLRPASFPVRFPDGPHDTEAIIVLPGQRVYTISKGRNHAVTVYRYPLPLRPDTVLLQKVQELTTAPEVFPYQVTGGAVSPRGSLLALRTYTALDFYRMSGDTLAAIPGAHLDLRPLREPQGEGVGIGLDGLVALTSEGGPGGGPARLTLLHCTVPGL